MTAYTIQILQVENGKLRRMPPAHRLRDIGVPPSVIQRYRKVRWDMTAGLKRRVRASQN